MGVDGEVVAAVEAQRDKGRKVTASRYIRVAVREVLASARKEPSLTLQLPGRDPVSGVHFAFVSNSSPWTYANTRPVWTNPTTTFETGLGRVRDHQHERVGESAAGAADVVASKPRSAGQAPDPRRRPAVAARDRDTPVACQIDGDYVGLRERHDVHGGSGRPRRGRATG